MNLERPETKESRDVIVPVGERGLDGRSKRLEERAHAPSSMARVSAYLRDVREEWKRPRLVCT